MTSNKGFKTTKKDIYSPLEHFHPCFMSNKSGNILIFPQHVKPEIFSIKLFSISWPPSPQTLLTDMKGRSKLWQEVREEIDGAFYIHLMCEEGERGETGVKCVVIHSVSMFSLLPVVCITRRR